MTLAAVAFSKAELNIVRAVVLFFIVGFAANALALPLTEVSDVRIKTADDMRWADPALDDSSWPAVSLNDVPETEGIVILRANVRLDDRNFIEGRPSAVFFAALASCELAWDDVIIGRGGHPAAAPADEIPGPIQAHWAIPDRVATRGDHVLALRCSAHHRNFHPIVGYWMLLVGDYETLLAATTSGTLIGLASLSGMLMVGLFALVMFFIDRRDRSFLLLGLLCICGAALLLAESWRTVFKYSYDWHIVRLLVVTALTALLNVAIVAFAIVRYPGRFARGAMLALLAGMGVALVVHSWDGKALLMFVVGLTLATAWVARAAWCRERGSIPALIGLIVTLVTLLWRPFQFADVTLYLALDFLLVCLLVAHAMQVRRVRQEREEALVKSARLEAELLRRHIQPHFLMNTLTALSEWIEEEPAVAVSMIEAISEEFRILARISTRTLIELGEELDLCRTHIEIMSRRRGREYSLRVEGVDPRDLIPPAIFHTLVENAISHDESREKLVELTLSAATDGARVRYDFSAPYSGSDARATEGTGLRYIRARLEESFGRDWAFESGPADGRWRTVVSIPRRR